MEQAPEHDGQKTLHSINNNTKHNHDAPHDSVASKDDRAAPQNHINKKDVAAAGHSRGPWRFFVRSTPGAFAFGRNVEVHDEVRDDDEDRAIRPDDEYYHETVPATISYPSHVVLPTVNGIIVEEEQNHHHFNKTIISVGVAVIFLVVVTLTWLVVVDREDTASAAATIETAAPTNAPTRTSLPLFLDQLASMDFYQQQHNNNSSAFLWDPSSPQHRAARWLDDTINIRDTINNNINSWTLQQRYALAVFYFAVGGDDHWTECSRLRPCQRLPGAAWLTSRHGECTWQGLECDEQGRLTHLVIADLPWHSLDSEDTSFYNRDYFPMPLQGTLPAELALLSSLQELQLLAPRLALPQPLDVFWGLRHTPTWPHLRVWDVPHIKGSSSLPGSIWRLYPHLTVLNLAGNGLTGKLPLDALDSDHPLEILDLSDNHLAGSIPADTVLHLPNLRILRLGHNDVTGTIPRILPHSLTHLDLRHTSVEGGVPSSLWGHHLVSLDVSHTPILEDGLWADNHHNNNATLLPTDWCDSLRVLRLDHTHWTGTVPAALGHCTNVLQELTLNGNPQLRGSLPSVLCRERIARWRLPLNSDVFLKVLEVDCGVECECCVRTCDE